jgi:DNA (cytosine-5)-methyltransferase 1
MGKMYTIAQVADLLSVSKQTVRNWDASGKLKAARHPINSYRIYHEHEVLALDKDGVLASRDLPIREKPLKKYNVIELFAGAGGLAIGL